MNFRKALSQLAEFLFKKTLIAFPFLIFALFVFGTIHEHGDENAALMYPIALILQCLFCSIICYILYYLTDSLTKQSIWNGLKYIAHLVLLVALTWFDPNGITFVVLAITVITLTLVNILTSIYVVITKPS